MCASNLCYYQNCGNIIFHFVVLCEKSKIVNLTGKSTRGEKEGMRKVWFVFAVFFSFGDW